MKRVTNFKKIVEGFWKHKYTCRIICHPDVPEIAYRCSCISAVRFERATCPQLSSPSEYIQRLSGFPGSPGHLLQSCSHTVHMSTKPIISKLEFWRAFSNSSKLSWLFRDVTLTQATSIEFWVLFLLVWLFLKKPSELFLFLCWIGWTVRVVLYVYFWLLISLCIFWYWPVFLVFFWFSTKVVSCKIDFWVPIAFLSFFVSNIVCVCVCVWVVFGWFYRNYHN